MLTRQERYILLNLIPGIGSQRLKRLLDHFGSLERIWQVSPEELQQIEGLGPLLAKRIATERQNERLLRDELAQAKQCGVAIVTPEESEYPRLLQKIPDPPLALYVRGTLFAEEAAVAIVGSRRASLYGTEVAERLAYDLALRGLTVVSGLARGIDAAAHQGALKASGRTIAVLGNGLASIYPPEHQELAEQIIAHGAVISEYPMRMEPLAGNFPRRNRLVSGLSLAVVVVEAGQRSGALITCTCALEQGREVLAIPGKINSMTSRGTHQLLRDGAKLVTCVEDILEELPIQLLHIAPQPQASAHAPVRDMETGRAVLTDGEQAVLAHLNTDNPIDLDSLVATIGLPAETCAATLLTLELKRCVIQLPGKRFVRNDRAGVKIDPKSIAAR